MQELQTTWKDAIYYKALQFTLSFIQGVVTLYDPVARWKDSKSLLKDHYEWLYRTKRVKSGIHVPIEEYGKVNQLHLTPGFAYFRRDQHFVHGVQQLEKEEKLNCCFEGLELSSDLVKPPFDFLWDLRC